MRTAEQYSKEQAAELIKRYRLTHHLSLNQMQEKIASDELTIAVVTDFERFGH